jgi:glutathione S-transferase
MTNIVLHHYPISPFGELARTALGLKGMAWQSVIIPMMMPKPDLVALTGGYARTPVLQIGADLYCDTAAILDVLEAIQPEPSLYPQPFGAIHRIVASWAGAAQFAAHVGAAFRDAPTEALPPGFSEDRKARFVGFDFDAMPRFAPHLETQVLATVSWLEGVLGDGRHYIGGEAAGHGDLALYSNLWFLKIMPFAADFAAKALSGPHIATWYERMTAIGHGKPVDISADDAIGLAARCEPLPPTGSVEGFSVGQRVAIQTEQSGDQPVEGALLRCDASGITVRYTSDRAGDVNVHFPRIGQIVVAT